MKIFFKLWLISCVFCLSAAAQSGINRRNTETQKKNQPPPAATPAPAPMPAPVTIEPDSNQDDAEPKDSASEAVTDDEILRVETNLVSIPVSVSDREGRFVLDLKKEDFQVFENGKPQEIAYFAATEQPFTVALVLDVSYSTHFKIEQIETAAYRFVMNLRPADKVMVVTFDDEFHVLSEPTNDRETLRRAINAAKIGRGTALYDTVDFTLGRFRKVKGRKAVLLFTDGVDTTSRESNDLDNLREAQESEALFYTIHYNTYEDVQDALRNPPIMTPNPVPGSPVPFPAPSKRPTIP